MGDVTTGDRDELARLLFLSRNPFTTWVPEMEETFDFSAAMKEAAFVLSSEWFARFKNRGDLVTSVDVRVAEIAARAEKATPGPWFREYNSIITPGPDEASTSAEWDEAYVAHCGKPRDQRDVRRIADADFISAARTDIPFLLSEVRRLRSVVEDAEKVIAEARERLSGADVAQWDSKMKMSIHLISRSVVFDTQRILSTYRAGAGHD